MNRAPRKMNKAPKNQDRSPGKTAPTSRSRRDGWIPIGIMVVTAAILIALVTPQDEFEPCLNGDGAPAAIVDRILLFMPSPETYAHTDTRIVRNDDGTRTAYVTFSEQIDGQTLLNVAQADYSPLTCTVESGSFSIELLE